MTEYRSAFREPNNLRPKLGQTAGQPSVFKELHDPHGRPCWNPEKLMPAHQRTPAAPRSPRGTRPATPPRTPPRTPRKEERRPSRSPMGEACSLLASGQQMPEGFAPRPRRNLRSGRCGSGAPSAAEPEEATVSSPTRKEQCGEEELRRARQEMQLRMENEKLSRSLAEVRQVKEGLLSSESALAKLQEEREQVQVENQQMALAFQDLKTQLQRERQESLQLRGENERIRGALQESKTQCQESERLRGETEALRKMLKELKDGKAKEIDRLREAVKDAQAQKRKEEKRAQRRQKEVERLQNSLRDAEALRSKEVSDAWATVEVVEAKHQQTLATLRDLLGSEHDLGQQGATQERPSGLEGFLPSGGGHRTEASLAYERLHNNGSACPDSEDSDEEASNVNRRVAARVEVPVVPVWTD